MRRISIASALIALPLFAGCGGGDEIPVVPVTGSVKVDGSPLAGASVAFIPRAADGRTAAATTDEDGRYELLTPGTDDPGALTGEYKVTVSKFEVKTVRTPEEAVAEAQKRGGNMLAPPLEESKNLLPAQYLNPDKSGLTASVTEDGDNVFDFDVKTK